MFLVMSVCLFKGNLHYPLTRYMVIPLPHHMNLLKLVHLGLPPNCS